VPKAPGDLREAQPPSDAMDEEAVELEASTPQKQVRRGGKWWAEHASEMERATPCRAKEPPGDERGKEAVHGWVAACNSCNLTDVRQQGYSHAEAERVQAPIMLMGTEAVQITQPKLGKLGDALDHLDPLISCLKAGPVRVSKLRDCHFRELSELGMLKAPCPLQHPPCGGEGTAQEAGPHLSLHLVAAGGDEDILLPVPSYGAHGALLRRASRPPQLDAGDYPVAGEPATHSKGDAAVWHGLLCRAREGSEGFRSIPRVHSPIQQKLEAGEPGFFKLVGREISECVTIGPG
jgi:hypothetical protein